MKKRSQIGYTTNWIFVVVAGGIILLVIIGAALKQQKTYEFKISKTMSETIRYSLDVALNSENFFNDVSRLSKFDFQTICYEDYLGLYVSNYESPINYILYAPIAGEGTRAFIWSLPIKISYPVTNVVYFLSPQNKIVIDNSTNNKIINLLCSKKSEFFHSDANVVCVNGNLKQKIKEFLRDEILTTLTIVSTSENWRDYENLLKKTKKIISKDHFYVINIKSGEQPILLEFQYYNVTNVATKTYYAPTYPHLIGAIVVGNPDLYYCISKKASKISSLMAEIIKRRVSILEKNSIDTCAGYYTNLIDKLNKIIEMENKCDYLVDYTSSTDYLNIHKIISNINENYLVVADCELIY